MSFKNIDIRIRSQRIRRVTHYFQKDTSKINKQIKELQSRPTRSEQKQIVIENYSNLISSLEIYLQIWKQVGGGTTGHLIGSSIDRIKGLMKLFENKG